MRRIKAEERVGRVFGKWTVLKITKRTKSRAYCLAECECGTVKEVRLDGVVNLQVASCGCSYFKETANYALSSIKGRYRGGAKSRGYSYNLTDEHFLELITSNCAYCGIEPSRVRKVARHTMSYNGIDRIDNSIGYEPDNVVTCCIDCNRAKSDLSHDDFLIWVRRLVEFNG